MCGLFCGSNVHSIAIKISVKIKSTCIPHRLILNHSICFSSLAVWQTKRRYCICVSKASERDLKCCNNHSMFSLDRNFKYTNDITEAMSLINCENQLEKKNGIKLLKCIVRKAFRFIWMVRQNVRFAEFMIHSISFVDFQLPVMMIKGVKLSATNAQPHTHCTLHTIFR